MQIVYIDILADTNKPIPLVIYIWQYYVCTHLLYMTFYKLNDTYH